MKHSIRIWTLLLFFFAAVLPTFSQEHLTFKGIPITGSVESFTKQMESKGFTYLTEVEGGRVFEGKFAGQYAATFVLFSPKTRVVWKVVVSYKAENSWYDLKQKYLNFKRQYTEKYGAPESTHEFFSDPYYEGDGYELTALSQDKCLYSTYYSVDTGMINISMSKEGGIDLVYEDKINCNKILKEQESEIENDI